MASVPVAVLAARLPRPRGRSVDRSESNDLSTQHPEKLQALIKAWFEEAEKNMVLPLDDRGAAEILGNCELKPAALPEYSVCQSRPTNQRPIAAITTSVAPMPSHMSVVEMGVWCLGSTTTMGFG